MDQARDNARDNARILRAALAEVASAALVLDENMLVVERTDAAETLLGMTIPLGTSAPEILCSEGPDRPVAEALAQGRPVSTTIPRKNQSNGFPIAVRAVPLREGEARIGFLLLLEADEMNASSPDALVELEGILTRDRVMKKLLADLRKVARSSASVLVRGETGSGKELIARAVHSLSKRAQGPFRALNCAALPPALLESELFGHVRGAFTGAVRDQKGHVQLAHGGTLFLDEVAELPLELQAKLLRVLQEKTVLPVGGRDPIAVDVRFVAATHRSLRKEVEQGRFRADLMFRLRVVPLFLPPLRARRGDIVLLATRFIEEKNALGERHIARITPSAKRALEEYDWPGNVRELQNAIEYAFVMGEGPMLTEADLPPEVRGEAPTEKEDQEPPSSSIPRDTHERAEAEKILTALEKAGGSRQKAAQALGISRVTLWRKLRALGIEEGHDEGGSTPS